jgi:hypothetical protein
MTIFTKDWWLDSVIGEDNWDVCLVEKDGVILATMPYIIKNKLGFKLCTMPALTQTLGPWFKPSVAKYTKQLSRQKGLMNQLIKQLPEFHYFSQNWHYSQINWLPFFWQGFQQTTKYTYVIEDLSDLDKVWNGFRENIRGDIRKASGRFNLVIDDQSSIDDFFKLNKKVFVRQGQNQPFMRDFILNLDNACKKNHSSKIFIAVDKEGRHHAGVFLIWDKNSAYYLMGGGDPNLRNSGATSFCMWEAIKFSSTVTKKFDFEGSMIEPVERFFRAFGAKQKTYFTITKTPSLLLRIRAAILSLRDV